MEEAPHKIPLMHDSQDAGLIIMKTTTWDLAQAKGALPTLSHLLLPAPDEAGSADRYVSGGLGRGSNLPNITQQESGRAGLHPSKCLHIPPSLQPLGQQDPASGPRFLHSSSPGCESLKLQHPFSPFPLPESLLGFQSVFLIGLWPPGLGTYGGRGSRSRKGLIGVGCALPTHKHTLEGFFQV